MLNRDAILRHTGASDFAVTEEIQQLWSGYGQILRLALEGSEHATVIVKHVDMPGITNHPRGWNSDRSHLRKVKSYQVESAWYQHYAPKCNAHSRVPQCYGIEQDGNNLLLILEDLDAAGFPKRLGHCSSSAFDHVLKWLANFHATFTQVEPEHLWQTGTYWHLDTRPDELAVMDEGDLKQAAKQIDQVLSNATYQTLVHGDAKLANFCFAEDEQSVAAVDFQYIGRGCGMKDLAYFVGSCFDESDCEKHETQLLDTYFDHLKTALSSEINFDELEKEWRHLYHYAWADFHRFLQGWCPTHWKITSYSNRVCEKVIQDLKAP